MLTDEMSFQLFLEYRQRSVQIGFGRLFQQQGAVLLSFWRFGLYLLDIAVVQSRNNKGLNEYLCSVRKDLIYLMLSNTNMHAVIIE